MRGRKDIYKDGKGFNVNPQNINRTGQNRKTISAVNNQLQEAGFEEATQADIVSCYLRLINIDVPELQKMIADATQPALVRIVGKAILSGKGFDVIEVMMNRAIGKAKQPLNFEGEPQMTINIKPIQWVETKEHPDTKTQNPPPPQNEN